MGSKSQYSFAVRHATLQDELVFKSLARFLMDSLRHQWRYEASDTADVMVVGYEPVSDGFNISEKALRNRVHILVGTAEAAPKHLMRPLRVSAVLLALNLAGDEISQLRAAGGQPAPEGETIFTLLRWPTLELLRIDKRFVRIAAVLAARPTTFADLVAKSAQDEAVCDQLLRLLSSARLIHESRLTFAGDDNVSTPRAAAINPAPNPKDVAPATMGLRVFATPATSEQIPAKSSQTEQPVNSLWGRIRRRLGIGVTPLEVTK